MTCHELDPLVTRFIDGECTETERATIADHLRQCPDCQTRVEVESTAKQLLQAHAALARTMGIAVPWRPRVLRLGQPALSMRPVLLLLLLTIVGATLGGVWFRPARMVAVGVIGDSFCGHEHRFTARFNVDEHECTLGCVKRGAEFVLVTDKDVYRISDQRLPQLPAFADRRVRIEGTLDGDRIIVTRMTPADDGVQQPAGGLR